MSVMKTTGSFGYNAICDVCGFKFKASMLRKRWDGFMVCKHDYEARHPMDFYTTRNDTHLLPWTRPDNVGVDVSPNSRLTSTGDYRITSDGSFRAISGTIIAPQPIVPVVETSIAGYAIAGYSISGL